MGTKEANVKSLFPLVTWTIVALNLIIFLWSMDWNLSEPTIRFSDLMMRPYTISEAISQQRPWAPMTTLFTSLFLHANWLHLIANMFLLVAFGKDVERAFGPMYFAGLFLIWGIVANLVQVFVDPTSVVPVIGASGAIAGIMGSYLLLFPGKSFDFSRIKFPWAVPVWIVLLGWLLLQSLTQVGVAHWAHIGGFLAGMVTVLLIGNICGAKTRAQQILEAQIFAH